MAQRLECKNIFEEHNDQMQKQGKHDKLLFEEDLVMSSSASLNSDATDSHVSYKNDNRSKELKALMKRIAKAERVVFSIA